MYGTPGPGVDQRLHVPAERKPEVPEAVALPQGHLPHCRAKAALDLEAPGHWGSLYLTPPMLSGPFAQTGCPLPPDCRRLGFTAT